MVIEEEFGVQVPPGDLEQFVSFELILDYLGRTISERTNPACVGTERPYTRPA
jgi:hypothetical protein